MIKICTIGFTKTSAEHFFARLKNSGTKKIIDIRLNNTSQLSGFAKSEDLKYFLKSVAGIDYIHLPILAPTEKILKDYKRDGGDWSIYENSFNSLMRERKIESRISPAMLDQTCLLCSEDHPHHCHRRLVVEYLGASWGEKLNILHL